MRLPAEWEPHAATWLAWPHQRSDWPGKFAPVPWLFVELARLLSARERVRLLVANPAEAARARALLESGGATLEAIDFVVAPTDRSWTRDSLPLFVTSARSGARGPGTVGAVKFRFDGWARYPNHRRDDAAGELVAERFPRRWRPESRDARGRRRRVVLEGGAIDGDGQGTLLATESCLLSGPFARNRDLGRTRTEAALRDFLGVRHVIWLEDGIAGDDTAGHVDDFARFVGPARVVVATEPRRRDPNHRPLARARERLQGARDALGRRLEVIDLPMPEPVAFAGQRLPASYANFYVANGVVLVPIFSDPSDRLALGRLAEVFAGREVIGFPCRDLVLGLGTLHCSTHEEPAARG
ncbi:MAG: agmatine deiminase family protein [Polyangiaceae bacterium]|nr:agmatine deiminase family protein [Polyangiaceae bacterium]